MWSVVKSKVGEMEDNTKEVRGTKIRKYVVGCVQDVVVNKKFLVKFEDGQKKDVSYSSLVFLSSKEEFEMDEPLYHSPEK